MSNKPSVTDYNWTDYNTGKLKAGDIVSERGTTLPVLSMFGRAAGAILKATSYFAITEAVCQDIKNLRLHTTLNQDTALFVVSAYAASVMFSVLSTRTAVNKPLDANSDMPDVVIDETDHRPNSIKSRVKHFAKPYNFY